MKRGTHVQQGQLHHEHAERDAPAPHIPEMYELRVFGISISKRRPRDGFRERRRLQYMLANVH